MKRAVIVVRMLPPVEVSPNFHGSWRKRAEAVADVRRQAQWATRLTADADAFSGKLDPVLVDAEIAWCCGRRRLDDDNAKASMKPVIDGIAAELWGGQDRHVVLGTVRQVRGEGTTTVVLRALGRHE